MTSSNNRRIFNDLKMTPSASKDPSGIPHDFRSRGSSCTPSPEMRREESDLAFPSSGPFLYPLDLIKAHPQDASFICLYCCVSPGRSSFVTVEAFSETFACRRFKSRAVFPDLQSCHQLLHSFSDLRNQMQVHQIQCTLVYVVSWFTWRTSIHWSYRVAIWPSNRKICGTKRGRIWVSTTALKYALEDHDSVRALYNFMTNFSEWFRGRYNREQICFHYIYSLTAIASYDLSASEARKSERMRS